MSGCQSNDKDIALNDSDAYEIIPMVNMARDIRKKLFVHNREREIDLEEGKTFTWIDEFREVPRAYAIHEAFYITKNEQHRVTPVCGISNTCN